MGLFTAAQSFFDGILFGTTDLRGGQLKFPSTPVPSADVTTLDDYLEGDWTPVANSFTIIGGLVSATGKYTKIGRIVTAHGSLTYATSIAGSAGTSYITGLPAGILPGISSANGGYANASTGAPLGAGAIFPSGNLYAPTFGAIATIAFSITYQV